MSLFHFDTVIFKRFIFLLTACFFVFGVKFPSEADVGKEKALLAVFLPSKSFVEESQTGMAKPASEDPAKSLKTPLKGSAKSQAGMAKSTSKDPAKSLKTSPKEPAESIPAFNKDNPQAKGVILSFHRWPDEKEKALLFKKLTKAGLKKKLEIKRFKIWIFEWSEWHKGEKAVRLCKKISSLSLSFLDYCEPNFLLGPAQVSREEDSSQDSGGKNQEEDSSQDSKKKDQNLRQSRYPIRESILGQGRNFEQGPPVIPERGKDVRDCNLVSSQLRLFYSYRDRRSTLSDYWAQERVGADLLKEELEKVPPVQKHLVAVFDSPQDGHHMGVKNLISDEGKHSVLPEIDKFTSIHDVSKTYKEEVTREKGGVTVTDTVYTSAYLVESNAMLDRAENICGKTDEIKWGIVPLSEAGTITGFLSTSLKTIVPLSEAVTDEGGDISHPPILLDEEVAKNSPIVAYENPYKQCKAVILPSFINNSMSWGRSVYKAFNALSPPSVVVTSAGNDYPEPVRTSKSKASRDFDAIIVGSLSPSGNRSDFSQEDLEVHIMAPSDNYISSADEDGNYKRFGGTSGATPLVTGSLAGFEWLSGYHPTAEEAKILLEKTAILTKYSHDSPRRNGVGMLNSYRLGMVGKRLKEECGDDIYCFKNMIRKDSTYEFPEDKDLLKDVERAFPECSQRTCSEQCLKA